MGQITYIYLQNPWTLTVILHHLTISNKNKQMKVIKIQLGEINRLTHIMTFDDLTAYSVETFCINSPLSVRYRDEEGDFITVSSEQEFVEALSVMSGLGAKVPKFEIVSQIRTEAQTQTQTQGIHDRVFCDECDRVAYISGIRYKCSGRPDFDLCGACEAKRPQPFPMLKIYNPTQAPAEVQVQVQESRRECSVPPWLKESVVRRNNSSHLLLKNAAGMQMFPGRGRYSQVFYCGRQLGTALIPHSNGRCGPSNGPQCPDCKNAQANLQKSAKVNQPKIPVAQSRDNSHDDNDFNKREEQETDDAKEETKSMLPELVHKEESVQIESISTDCFEAELLTDITFAPGSTVLCGASLIKTWLVRNSGAIPWSEKVRIGEVEIERQVAPGETTEVSVRLTAPLLPGPYQQSFQLATPHGVNFGPELSVDLIISDEEDNGGWQVLNASMFFDADENIPLPASMPNFDQEAQEEAETSYGCDEATIWATELALLSDMGFSDPKVVLPVLKHYMSIPISSDTALDARLNAKEIQEVICALLSSPASETTSSVSETTSSSCLYY